MKLWIVFLASCSSIKPLQDRVLKKEAAPIHKPGQTPKTANLGQTIQTPKAVTPTLELNYEQDYFNRWLDYFDQKQRDRFIRHLKRSAQYEPVIRKIFKEHGLPEDLFFVGLIESGFSLHIRSHANARGAWQFISSTGRRYGLRVQRQADERRNIHKSTEAAANYFKDLYNIFGSWELALCAYNAGEYRIIGAIRKGNTRDYQTLTRKRLLPRETVNYIPKLAAARHLANQERFKQYRVVDHFPYEKAEIFPVSKPFSLKKLAQKSGVSLEILKKLNPDLMNRTIYPGRKAFHLIAFQEDFPRLARGVRQIKSLKTPLYQSNRRYRVRRGDTLSAIARRFKTRISTLKKWNRLRGNQIFIGQKIIVAKNKRTGYTYHHVKKGQTLSKVARTYSVPVDLIRKANNIRGNRILAGQRLKITRRFKTYIVKRGDNLFKIARRFGTSVRRLVKMNSLTKKVIYPRQRILIPARGL